MFLDPFYHQHLSAISISAEQGSEFAKTVSNDFNPIHNVDAKRFCVPGDLLFALVLQRYGLSQTMTFNFLNLLPADIGLLFPPDAGDHFEIVDDRGKGYLQVCRSGETLNHRAVTEQLIRSYVLFSGQNFPHILVPLMAEKNVMINPQRPLVIYESMSLNLDKLNLSEPTVELGDTHLEVMGKRGEATLQFHLLDGGKPVGCGVKKLILSGLRQYRQEAVDQMVCDYLLAQ